MESSVGLSLLGAAIPEQQEWPRQGGQGAPPSRLWEIEVPRGDRGLVWKRLQELDISCTYRLEQPLLVAVDSPWTVWQVWHVVRMQGEPAPLRDWLERCYRAAVP
ncbi:MAG: Asr1405/Asl0597 family protein [Pseudanabaenaceae cyanobacterium]